MDLIWGWYWREGPFTSVGRWPGATRYGSIRPKSHFGIVRRSWEIVELEGVDPRPGSRLTSVTASAAKWAQLRRRALDDGTIANVPGIRVGDLYEDCGYHPVLCTHVDDDGTATGISLIAAGSRSAAPTSGVVLTIEQVWRRGVTSRIRERRIADDKRLAAQDPGTTRLLPTRAGHMGAGKHCHAAESGALSPRKRRRPAIAGSVASGLGPAKI